jgi:iron complex transport system substrate-binding protein
MKSPARRFLLRLCIVLALAVSAGAGTSDAAGVRVVSQTVGSDELLLALAAPEQIAALSHIATESAFSAVADEAKRFPRLQRSDDAEGILRHAPTLVLFADYSRFELVEQIRRAGVAVLVFDRYATLEDAYANLRKLGRAIGPEALARAEAIVADCERRVAQLRDTLRGAEPVRVIAPSTYGVIPGRDTTFQDLCDHAAADNLGASLAGLVGHAPPPAERMLTWPVDRIVVGGESLPKALEVYHKLPPYSLMPAVREGRAVLIEPWQLSCVSHHRVRAYEALARALHPERFAP